MRLYFQNSHHFFWGDELRRDSGWVTRLGPGPARTAKGDELSRDSGWVTRLGAVPTKRTTARKLYLALPTASKRDQWAFGNVVFFDDLKHCGIVDSRAGFYHAESSKGTNLSRFDPYWRPKVSGVRRIAPKR